MAELYENPRHYVTEGGTVGDSSNGAPTFERMLADLPPEEREEAMKYITAPPSGEEIMRAMQEKNARGEVMNMTLDQYRLYKAHNKTKETDVIAGIGEAAGTVFDEIQKAATSIIDSPVDSVKKLTPSVVEAFAQGTRNLYGMAAQSADPNSVFFRMKNALQANGDDEEAELQQFMEAQAFNVHSMRLMTGQDTIIMDKDIINPEMTQVMSYIADPTLFIPFGGWAAKGASMIGMGEKLAMAGARTQAIRNMVLGGAIKWGVGAPLEFMGGAIRNTIDYGIETGSRAIETATGVSAKEIQSATRVGTVGTAAASTVGLEVNSTLGQVSKLYAGSGIARNVGEAASIYGEQMMKQGKTGRGVLGYAGQAIRDTERAGIKLTPQTKSLLKAIEAVDPLFVYADDITSGAMQGAVIGGGLGYLAGGEEGMAGGIGSGMALGAIGATAGKVIADVTGNTKIDQMAIQRKLVIEFLKEQGNENAIGFEAMAAMAQATGDRAFQGYIDGIIAGIDTVNPDTVFKAFNTKEYEAHLKRLGVDPNTGVLKEKTRIFPELVDRTIKADVLGILRDTGNRFAGDPEGFERAIKNSPEFSKLKPVWSRLDDNAKQVILNQVKANGDAEFVKSLRGRQLNAHWADLAYSERLAEMINTLHQKNANSVPDKIRETLKAETRSDKKLTRRGQMLKEKLQADGYIDKDGNIRSKRLADVEGTVGEFEASAGWAKRRDSNGRSEVVINLDKWAMDSGNRLSLAHELYHSIMMESVFAPDYIDRLSQKLLGKFDPKTGKVLEQALVQPNELMKFFSKYIENDPNNRGDAETIKRKKEELQKSIEEFRTRGTANRVADSTAIPLEHLVEEFGAYYFSKWVKAQPIDYMFRGGEFGGIRGLFEMASDGWLDYWKGKVNENNPQFNFDAMGVSGVSKAFERDGKRVSSRSLDLFMRDIVRIEANRNSNNGFDVNKLSKESREWFIKVNGLRGAEFGMIDKQGSLRKPKLRRYTAEEIRQGKEMFKILESLPESAHKDGMRRDGNGNWNGKPNTAQVNALVGAGYIQRAWFDRMLNAFSIIEGNGPNVVEFGYLGYSAHIGDGDARVYGAAVPFKNRKAVLIGVDFKVRADGTVFSNFHTLDLKVIEARGNEIWKDPQTRELWKGSRTDMEADFYAYLSNASLPSEHKNRRPSARLLDKGDGLGGQRRDALHQMLGFHKNSDLPYINRPIAEIPVGIRHSVTTFSNDGIVNLRVDNKPRYDFNFENAHLDLSRNFMPDEMTQEKTPSGGKIIRHATGYKISKQAGEKFKVFDPEGKYLGDFDAIADAGRAAQKHFNDTYDKSVEGKDPSVPNTEVPPSRVAYKDKRINELVDINDITQKAVGEIERRIQEQKDKFPSGGQVYDANTRYYVQVLDSINKKGILRAMIEDGVDPLVPTDKASNTWRFVSEYTKEATKKAEAEYDAMYPMEIKSALHGTLAQIFQDYPQITAKGLIGKIQKYGSLNKARLMQEATEIGLIDLLKSKPMATKVKRDIYRAYDPFQRDFTGEVKVKETNVQYEPNVDINEILDFVKSKEIRVTIEEGAREVRGLNTSEYTLGGAKSNYKATAIRINPEYAHGVIGHYGPDTIVHFRTTVRMDADGNKHLYIEEVQANNPYNTETPEQVDFSERKAKLDSAKKLRDEQINRGLFVLDEDGVYRTAKDMLINDYDHRRKVLDAISRVTGSNGERKQVAVDRQIFENIAEAVETTSLSYGKDDIIARLDDVFTDIDTFDSWQKLKNDKDVLAWIDAGAEINKKTQDFREAMSQEYNNSGLEFGEAEQPNNLIASISDMETRITQMEREVQGNTKPFPMTDVKDWTLSALKGIIRQAIRDGLDKITLTHPDDSPTVSVMKEKARKPLYGEIIPQLWGSWLRRYGIEIKQSNKLSSPTLESAKNSMAKMADKIHDANQNALDRLKQVQGGENPQVINSLAVLLSSPVHEFKKTIQGDGMNKGYELINQVNDVKLRDMFEEVLMLKATEVGTYDTVLKIQEQSIPEQHNLGKAGSSGDEAKDARISAEAIDRGMTFELNDRIKREFLEGRINTHSMPAEGEQGGRVYTNKQMAGEFIGRYASENPKATKGLVVKYNPSTEGSASSLYLEKKDGSRVGSIDIGIFGTEAEIVYSSVGNQYQRKGFGNLMYSELIERLRSQGVETVTGMIIDDRGRPLKIRRRIIDQENTRVGGERTSIGEVRRDEEGSTQTDVTSYLKKKAWYMPAEVEQGAHKPRYEIDQLLVDKLKNTFKKDEQLSAYELLKFIVDNNGFMSPLAKIMMESLDQKGLSAAVMQQGTSGKKGQKGAAGWTRANYEPWSNKVHMVLERVENRKKTIFASYEECAIEEVLHAITFSKVPEAIKHGTTIETVSKNIDYLLANEKNFSETFEGNENRHLGTDKGWFTLARAWKEVKKSYDTGLRPDGIAMTRADKHVIEYRLSNMAEFIVGVTQDKEMQAILSKIKVPKSEVSLLQRVFNAIKKIWKVSDDAMDSLLAQTSDAAERILTRDRQRSEVQDGGIFAENSKYYTLGSPKFMPSEPTRGGRTYTDQQLNTEFIGRFALENPDIANKYIIRLKDSDSEEGSGYKIVIYDKDTKKPIARSKWEIIEDDNGKQIEAAADVEILDISYKGKQLSHLMQSERLERSRFLGAESVKSQITNQEGIPIKNYARTIGENKGEITSAQSERFLNEGSYVPATMENFKKEMDASIANEDGTWKPTVYYRAKLDPKAHYMPAEGDDYRGSHKAPSGENGEGSLDAMDRTYPEDIYSVNGARYYGTKEKSDAEMISIIQNLRGKPDELVSVYRAVPKGTKGEINAGDWVTPSKAYARLHGGRWEEGMRIIEKKVPAGELFTEGNSIYEFGWSPKKKSRADVLREEIASEEKWMERRRSQAPVLWETKGSKIYGQRMDIERRISSLKYELKQLEREGKTSFMPAEGWRDWKSERTSLGSVVKNAVGYVIMMQGNKFKVYNPYKALVGIYSDLEQAKRRVQRDEPKQ
jgi:hypothetical protein